MTAFTTTAVATFLAILKIFLVIFLAGFLVRRRVLTDAMVTALTKVHHRPLSPRLILDKILMSLSPERLSPLVDVATGERRHGAGRARSGLRCVLSRAARKRSMLAVASMQNAGYLILPVGAALYPEPVRRIRTFCFALHRRIQPDPVEHRKTPGHQWRPPGVRVARHVESTALWPAFPRLPW